MKRSCIALAVVAGLGFFGASFASAASVTATLYGVPAGLQPGTDTLKVSFGLDVYNGAYVGQINWHGATSTDWNSGLNAQLQSILGADNTFSTYCIEGTQNVYFGSSETWQNGVVDLSAAPVPGGGMGTAKATLVSEFWNRFYSDAGTSNEYATAFQLGIWEIVTNGITVGSVPSDIFDTGTFQASASASDTVGTAALSDATTWLGELTGTYTGGDYTVYALSDDGIQDQIFAVPNGTGSPPPATPLPAALPAGLALLGALGAAQFVRRRRAV